MRFTRVWAAFAAFLSVSAAQAWEPAEGTISLETPSLTAEGGPFVGVNPTPAAEPTCVPELCDIYTLTSAIPEGYRSANPNQVVRIQTKGFEGDDLDMYVYNDATDELLGTSASDGAEESVDVKLSALPAVVRVEVIIFLGTGSTGTLEINIAGVPGGGGGGVEVDPCVVTGAANSGSAVMDLDVRRDFTALASNPSSAYGAFVRFNQGTNKQQDAILKKHGLVMKGDFRKYVNSVFVQGPVSAFNALAREPSVGRLEYNTPIRYLDATASWASRARIAQEPVSGGPYLDASNQIVSGQGQLLGVIDSGLWGFHQDFAGQIFKNFKLINFALDGVPQYIDVGEADSENGAGGHGTHVTGTVMGNGVASDGGYPVPLAKPNVPGTFAGVAPAADMIHWAHGAGLFVLSAVTAYEHMLDNLDTFEAEYGSKLRAVNNSYGSAPAPYQPGATSSCLIKDIVERGVVMVFAASNEGGDGSTDQTSPTCKDPTPGVICVASYNDGATGDISGPLSTFSSRGKRGPTPLDAINYPDIAAPGDLITSTCAQASPTQVICTGGDDSAAETEWQPLYGTISGTSMAAPHITGAIGLMTQLKPDLTPGEIEVLLQKHARKIGDGYQLDPQQPNDGTIHFAYGAGLVNMAPLLEELGARKSGLPPAGGEWTVLDGDVDDAVAALASDAQKLTMQEETFGGSTGVRFRIGVADASDVLSTLAFRVDMNVAGDAYASTVLYDGTDVTPAEPGATNTAVATDTGIDGDTLNFFVPYSSMGFPAVNEPIHNIRVVVSDDSGAVDYAPSPAGAPAAIAAVQPMYGRAFTIQLPAGLAPPSNEKSCVAPGLTMATSPAGLTGNGAGLPAEDLRHVWFAEPETMPGKLVITMKVAGLAQIPPNYRWYTYFKVPGDAREFFAAMDTTQATPRFLFGNRTAIDTPAGGVGSFAVLGNLDPLSARTPDGTITLVIDKAGFVVPITEGMELTGISGSIRQTTNPQNGAGLTVDSAGAIGGYTVAGNACKAAEVPVTPVPPTPAPPPVVMAPAPVQAAAAAPSNEGRFGGGALGLLLLPLLAAAGLRRRPARR